MRTADATNKFNKFQHNKKQAKVHLFEYVPF